MVLTRHTEAGGELGQLALLSAWVDWVTIVKLMIEHGSGFADGQGKPTQLVGRGARGQPLWPTLPDETHPYGTQRTGRWRC